MKVIKLTQSNNESAVAACVEVLLSGSVAAFPTETFYALGARFDDEDALRRLCTMKRRPATMELPLILGGFEALAHVAQGMGDLEKRIAEKFWPGPLTILLDAGQQVSPLITAGTGRVAVRVPGSSFALELARAFGVPITATSANLSGMPPAATAEDVLEYFEDLDLLVDGGETAGGAASTIIRVGHDREIEVLRQGPVSKEEILKALKESGGR